MLGSRLAHAWNRPRPWIGSLLLVVSVVLLGCPFDPRVSPEPCDPNDPGCSPPVPFNPPDSPEVVRDNIVRMMNAIGPVEPNYGRSLSLDFSYLPDPNAANPRPGHFDGWDKTREVQFMLNVLEAGAETAPQSVDVVFTEFTDSGELTDPSRRRYNVRYEITLEFPDTTQVPPVRVDRFGAVAQWDLEDADNRNFWTLEKWEDIEPLGTPFEATLGELRGQRG